jgi:glycerol-3-phosphate cytidylyltransferase
MEKYSIGIIAGNFDVIHPGYIYMFNECAKNCENLVVLLHSDPSIERPEKLKPILSVNERMDILLSLRQIREVLVYETEKDLLDLIEWVNPDVRFLGDDYVDKPYTGDNLNIPVYFLNRSHGWSTTKYKTLIAQTVK